MARPVDHEQHRQMATAALEVVRKGGVAGLSMARLARDLGVKRSTLYWYFGNLGEVFEAVLGEVLERQGIAVAERVAEAEHPVDQIAAWMRAVHAFYGDDPELLQVLIQLWAVGRPEAPAEAIAPALARFEPIRAAAVALLEEGLAAGTVGPCAPEALVDLCSAVMDGALVHRVSRGLPSGPTLDLFIAQVLTPLRLTAGPTPRSTSARPAPDRRPPAAPPRAARAPSRPARDRAHRADTWLEED